MVMEPAGGPDCGGDGDMSGREFGAVGEGVVDGVAGRGDELVYELREDGETSVT
jgi:hypothetical protein